MFGMVVLPIWWCRECGGGCSHPGRAEALAPGHRAPRGRRAGTGPAPSACSRRRSRRRASPAPLAAAPRRAAVRRSCRARHRRGEAVLAARTETLRARYAGPSAEHRATRTASLTLSGAGSTGVDLKRLHEEGLHRLPTALLGEAVELGAVLRRVGARHGEGMHRTG